MASPKKLNLTTLYSQYVHVPIMPNTENKSPLYARTSYDNGAECTSLNRDEYWMRASASTYNSPTNVRRIALGTKKVLIGFWKPYIKGDRPNPDGNWRLRDIVGVNPGDVAKEQGMYEILASKGTDMAYLSKFVPENVLSGFPLKCITTPWVLSNLEEIYIDPRLLLSQDISPRVGTDIIDKATRGVEGIPSNMMESILCLLAGKPNAEELLKQIPRLKIFGIVRDLDTNIESCLRDVPEGRFLVQNFRYMQKGGLSVYKTPLFGKINLDILSTRPMYVFDAQVLAPYAESLHNKLLSEARDKRDRQLKQEGKVVGSTTKGEVEVYLDRVWDEEGSQFCLTLIQLTFARATRDDRKLEYERLTEAGKARYATMLG